jgi:hypothetical protein
LGVNLSVASIGAKMRGHDACYSSEQHDFDCAPGASKVASTAMEIRIKRLEFLANALRTQNNSMADRLSDTQIEPRGHFRALSSTIELAGKIRM